ncbi:hypothetical protein EYF80_042415 [Liparis tanakae]|uniref:Uncharacterized protein n=1 Tax=Liparis tanakae TaxID=230148 RepID=A0A4Z2G4C8_9TELE|nr:hypothetical protein EYF80_042415 [Liparis tanakae]
MVVMSTFHQQGEHLLVVGLHPVSAHGPQLGVAALLQSFVFGQEEAQPGAGGGGRVLTRQQEANQHPRDLVIVQGSSVPDECVLPEAGQRQPAGQQPGLVAEASVQVGVELRHVLVQHAADLLPVEAAAGRQDDELGQGLKQLHQELHNKASLSGSDEHE